MSTMRNKFNDIFFNRFPKENDFEDDYEAEGHVVESSLALEDILPKNPKFYDKNRPPKNRNQPTIVYFHVTVLSIDSINEESMVRVDKQFFSKG